MVGKVIQAIFGRRNRIAADKLVELIEEMRGYITRDLRGGFSEVEEIADGAVEMVSDQADPEALRPHAVRLLNEEIEKLRLEQQKWPEVTDCDRLDAAFDALEARGVVCRQNFTCCGTCGSGEIWDEIRSFEENGKSPRGYAFFHMQDTESAVEGHGLYLNYGAVDEGEQSALDVAREIVAEINGVGLQAEWDGSWSKRIGVKLDWKRRIPI